MLWTIMKSSSAGAIITAQQRRIGSLNMARQALLVALAASWSSSSASAFCFVRPALTTTSFGGGASLSSAAHSSNSLTLNNRLYDNNNKNKNRWLGATPSQLRTSASSSSTSTSTSSSDTPVTLPDFGSVEEYTAYLQTVSALPKGFATGTGAGKFISAEAPALGPLPIRGTVIYLTEGPTDSWAAVFTSNKFPGSPIYVGKSRLASGGPLHAIVINNKVSNVCSGGDGIANAELVCEAVAKGLNLPGDAKTVLPCSTGVIGWRLPAVELAEQVVPEAIAQLKSESAFPAAQAIMTTDRFPKVRSITLSNGARIVGIAKGAGMIEPNLATMLSYIMTDATVDKATMQRLLSNVVQGSFNSISVDGDESTSDTVVWLSSNQVPAAVSEEELESALRHVCQGLAADIVRNGEGTSHVLRVTIQNYPGPSAAARRLGRHIVNSPLFKCAVTGNDPNTGRLAAAIGSWLGKFYAEAGDEPLALDQVTMTLGGRVIFTNSKFVLEGDAVEKALSQHIQDAEYSSTSHYPPHQKCVEIQIDFGTGSGQAVVLGSDLTNEYISVNADYRS